MSKLRSLNDLQDRIDEEFAWRLKELDSLKKIVRQASLLAKKTAIRSAICLAYSHWEGFVKRAAEYYIEFVSNQRLQFDQLADCFVWIGARRHLASMESDGKIVAAVSGVNFFRTKLNERAYLRLPGHVNTRSNLNSEVFENIALTVGISTDAFRARYNQIDESLLGRRNRIAHGEFLDIDQTSCISLVDDVIGLLRMFKTEIEDAASSRKYASVTFRTTSLS
jgi:hypothetical protein